MSTVTLDKMESEEYTVCWSGGDELLPPRDSNPNQLWQTPEKVHRCPAHQLVFEWDVDDDSDTVTDPLQAEDQGESDGG